MKQQTVFGYNCNDLPQEALGADFQAVCRTAAAEGAVLLRNEHDVLPLQGGTTVALFGRIQTHYVKSGTGSGGLVNVPYVVGIPEGLKNAGIRVDEVLAAEYAAWEAEHPFDNGKGWASEPWSQVEMPLTASSVQAAAERADVALVVIGRTAGEDRDNAPVAGSYLLSDGEETMLAQVTAAFDKVVVLLNVGNIIDMQWVETYRPSAVLYVWQGGQEGGNAVADLLTGRVSPSGRLADTVARTVQDYPSTEHFGNAERNFYCEDIYVGYRYFVTFAKEKVLYPFGFGLSYTTFAYSNLQMTRDADTVTVCADVRNSGKASGKEVVQVYLSKPQGKLGQPARVLAAYGKTETLAPNEVQTVRLQFSLADMASFDDTGVTGNHSCFVLEKGDYCVQLCKDALSPIQTFSFRLDDDLTVKRGHAAMSPAQPFKRMRPAAEDGGLIPSYEDVPAAEKCQTAESLQELPFTGDCGIRLADVRDGKATMEAFLAQLTDEDLACISFGEGMNSVKVTGGTGCAFGGVTDSLLAKGIPIACGTDGPSGIRMDSGARATSMPNGTALACTWNDALAEELYTYEGIEMAAYHIDALLGPGINLHRNPQNGRNFEYLSEDPLLAGGIAAALCRGIAKTGATATIKHFCCNNQEHNRHHADSVVSERALRELYLKPFELALRDGSCRAVMTSYNPVNGVWSCGNADLNTVILRDEWGFDGFVMSDWWAKTEKDFTVWGRQEDTPPLNFAPMVNAQNDIYMVHRDASDFSFNTILQDLQDGKISRAALQRNAANLCRFLMHSNAMDRTAVNKLSNQAAEERLRTATPVASCAAFSPTEGFRFQAPEAGSYLLSTAIASNGSGLSQTTAVFYVNDVYACSFTVNGTDGKALPFVREITLPQGDCRITAKYPDTLLTVENLTVSR